MLLCVFYSGVILEPTTAACFTSPGIWIALKGADSRKESLFLFCAGSACGVSTLFREEGFILTAAVMLALVATHF